MKLPNEPRVVITGGASGLGRAFGVELAKVRARILIADINEERLQEAAAELRNHGATVETTTCDVGKLEEVTALAERAEQLWGGTDLLINNAGVACAGAVGEIPIENWEWIMRINLWGVIYGCHAFLPKMKERKSGAVINVASSAAIASLPEMGPYNVTKAAVLSLSETLYAELAPFNISVSALCPTFFQTNLLETMRATQPKQTAQAKKMFERSLMTADQVARASLKGLERGQLVVIPQIDGQVIWRAKRTFHNGFYRALRGAVGSGVMEKLSGAR